MKVLLSAWQSSSLVPLPLSENDTSTEHIDEFELTVFSESDDEEDVTEEDEPVSLQDSPHGCSCTIGSISNCKKIRELSAYVI